MGSKVIVFLGFFLAMVLLISSQVAAREMAESSDTVDTSSKDFEEANGAAANDPKYSGGEYGGYSGGGGGGYSGGGGGGYHHGGGGSGGGGGGHCYHGCCGQSHYGGGCKCCSYAGEKADAKPQAKPQT